MNSYKGILNLLNLLTIVTGWLVWPPTIITVPPITIIQVWMMVSFKWLVQWARWPSGPLHQLIMQMRVFSLHSTRSITFSLQWTESELPCFGLYWQSKNSEITQVHMECEHVRINAWFTGHIHLVWIYFSYKINRKLIEKQWIKGYVGNFCKSQQSSYFCSNH